MAIRKMRKQMKPVIWVITIAFFLAAAAGSVASIKSILNNKTYAFKVNGEKVAIQELERGINNVSNQYSQYFKTAIDRDDAKILATDNIIINEILKEIGKDLKVKVSSKELKTRLSAIETQFDNKDQFKRMLNSQGYSKSSFERSIKDSLIVEKTRDKVLSAVEVSEDEIKNKYEANKYSEYLGKTYEEEAQAIKNSIKEEKGNKELIKMIEKRKKNIEVEDIRENYGNILATVEFEEEGFAITNLDILRGSLYQSFYGVKDYKEAKEKAALAIKDEIRMAKIALERGAVKDESLPTRNQILDLKAQLINKIKEDLTITDIELKDFFNKNKESYNIEASVDAKILEFIVKPTDLDKSQAKERAVKLLEKVTPENFVETAKLSSEGPSAPNGGDLGWVGKGQMIPEFETAVFASKVGVIYPEVVESKFGYHIIYVEDKRGEGEKEEVKASHILIKATPGNDTYTKVMGTAKVIAEELKTQKTTFEAESKKEYSKFKIASYLGIKKDGYIQGMGYKNDLSEAIFKAPLKEVTTFKGNDGIYVFEKEKEIKFEEATFEKTKENLLIDYKNQKVIEELKKL